MDFIFAVPSWSMKTVKITYLRNWLLYSIMLLPCKCQYILCIPNFCMCKNFASLIFAILLQPRNYAKIKLTRKFQEIRYVNCRSKNLECSSRKVPQSSDWQHSEGHLWWLGVPKAQPLLIITRQYIISSQHRWSFTVPLIQDLNLASLACNKWTST